MTAQPQGLISWRHLGCSTARLNLLCVVGFVNDVDVDLIFCCCMFSIIPDIVPQAVGGGWEYDDYYGNTDLTFLDIGNIHVMRERLAPQGITAHHKRLHNLTIYLHCLGDIGEGMT